jgi:hypothetical protein
MIIKLFHSALQSASTISAYRVLCPCCAEGVLGCIRNDSAKLTNYDFCQECGQQYQYLDTAINEEVLVKHTNIPIETCVICHTKNAHTVTNVGYLPSLSIYIDLQLLPKKYISDIPLSLCEKCARTYDREFHS